MNQDIVITLLQKMFILTLEISVPILLVGFGSFGKYFPNSNTNSRININVCSKDCWLRNFIDILDALDDEYFHNNI